MGMYDVILIPCPACLKDIFPLQSKAGDPCLHVIPYADATTDQLESASWYASRCNDCSTICYLDHNLQPKAATTAAAFIVPSFRALEDTQVDPSYKHVLYSGLAKDLPSDIQEQFEDAEQTTPFHCARWVFIDDYIPFLDYSLYS